MSNRTITTILWVFRCFLVIGLIGMVVTSYTSYHLRDVLAYARMCQIDAHGKTTGALPDTEACKTFQRKWDALPKWVLISKEK